MRLNILLYDLTNGYLCVTIDSMFLLVYFSFNYLLSVFGYLCFFLYQNRCSLHSEFLRISLEELNIKEIPYCYHCLYLNPKFPIFFVSVPFFLFIFR